MKVQEAHTQHISQTLRFNQCPRQRTLHFRKTSFNHYPLENVHLLCRDRGEEVATKRRYNELPLGTHFSILLSAAVDAANTVFPRASSGLLTDGIRRRKSKFRGCLYRCAGKEGSCQRGFFLCLFAFFNQFSLCFVCVSQTIGTSSLRHRCFDGLPARVLWAPGCHFLTGTRESFLESFPKERKERKRRTL